MKNHRQWFYVTGYERFSFWSSMLNFRWGVKYTSTFPRIENFKQTETWIFPKCSISFLEHPLFLQKVELINIQQYIYIYLYIHTKQSHLANGDGRRQEQRQAMVEAAMTCASLADAHAVELFSGGARPAAPWRGWEQDEVLMGSPVRCVSSVWVFQCVKRCFLSFS